jgi:hypothetical protein
MAEHHHDLFNEGPDWMLIFVNTAIVASFVGVLVWMVADGYGDAVGGIGWLILTILTAVIFAAAVAALVAALLFALVGLVELVVGGPAGSRLTLALQLVIAAIVLVLLGYAAGFALAILSGHDFNQPHGYWS